MDRDKIRQEVARLAPWYYAFDLGGVRTDELPPCDYHGHRRVTLPVALQPLLAGKSVLDCGCNEGGYSFQAIERGAAHVTGFDVRPVNVEKATLVAAALGIDAVDFHVATCDGWLLRAPQPVDWVFLCGLIYHLEDPPATIARFCELAREGVLVTCILNGGADGYSPFREQETIAASADPEALSRIPNSMRTLVLEFRKHQLHPLFASEGATAGAGGNCGLVLRRTPADLGVVEGPPGEDVDVFLAPTWAENGAQRAIQLDVLLCNRQPRPLSIDGRIRVLGADGALLAEHGPDRYQLDAGFAGREGVQARRFGLRLEPTAGARRIEVSAENVERGTRDAVSLRLC